MDVTLRTEITNLNADPDFVEFVRAWHGEIGAVTSTPFSLEIQSPACHKKIKRWTQRDFKDKWMFAWKVIMNECWKARRKMVVRRNLFTLEPSGPNPAHRQQNKGRWNAIFDLRNYFINIDRRPHMRLLGQLFYPNQEEDTFLKEWYSRKDWFTHENGAERLERLEQFYKHNHARILETLRTKVPFYARWESESVPVLFFGAAS